MGYTIPEGVDTMLDVVGVGWPNVDEDAYRDMADSLREFADDADDDGHAAHQHIQRLLSSGQSESLTALDTHWSKVQGKHKDLASAARIVAGALDRVADIIVARKVAAVAELADLCATVGITLAFAPVTAGLSTLLAGAKIAATRIAFKRILKEMAEAAVAEIVATLTEPAVAAIENVVADLAIQTALNVTGVQDGYHTGQTAQAGKDGLRLASADGAGTGPGGGPGGGGGPRIDHDAHGQTGMHLAGVQVTMRDRTGGKLGKARGHHGRAKGKDSLTAVLDTTIDGVVEKLGKALNDLGDHLGKKLPNAITRSSKNHKDTDDDIRDRLRRIASDDRKDEGGPGGRRNGPGPGPERKRPTSLREALDRARELAVSLFKRRCKTDPVDIASGEMVLAQTDLALPGVLWLVLRRTHISSYRFGRSFGTSWASTLDERLEPAGAGAAWAREDGSVLVYPGLPGEESEEVLPLEGDRLPLRFAGRGAAGDVTYEVTDPHSGLTRRFTGSPYRAGGLYWLGEIEDRNGNAFRIGRGDDGIPATVVHEGGYRVAVSSEPETGRVTGLAVATSDGPVRVATFGYDAGGNLEAVTNVSGRPLRFTYDGERRVTSWTDRNGHSYRYVYDSAGRVVQTVGPDGALSSRFSYDTVNRVTRFTDSTGAVTVTRLNELGQVIAETDPLGNTVLRQWDRYDNLLSRTDELGNTAEFTWDDHGNLTSIRRPDGSRSSTVYNEFNLPVEAIYPDGATWRQSYDARGNRVSLTAPDGSVSYYRLDPKGAPAEQTDPTGATERLTYNGAGVSLTLTDPLGHRYTVLRDAFGRPVRTTDPNGAVTAMEWTPEGWLSRCVRPDGTEELWTWDDEGNCLSHVGPRGEVTRFEYTHFDLLKARIGADGARYEFAYDTELRLTEVRNPQGMTWTYAYDAAGNPVAETDFDGRTVTYAYDAAGRLVHRTTPLGERITTGYDPCGRVVSKEVAGQVTRYAYDAGGQPVSAVSPTSTVAWQRDVLGRVVAETVDGRTLRFAYDAAGRTVRRITPAGVVSDSAYDATGNRTALSSGGNALSFTHDPLGRELTRTMGLSEAPLTLTSDWDSAGRLASRALTTRDRTLRARSYAYRADGFLEHVTDELTHTSTRFELDPVGRPTQVTAENWSESYVYDSAGNQTMATWPDDARRTEERGARTYEGTRMTAAGAVRCEYDGAGRTLVRRRTRLSRKPDVWQYSWDAENRLVACRTPDGGLWQYSYDPLGRRTAKHRMADDGGSVLHSVYFTWDGTRLVEQTDTTNHTTLTWEYDGRTPLVQLERRSGPESDTGTGTGTDIDSRFFAIVSDLIGAPSELVDEQGRIAWQARTTVWGATRWNRTAVAYTPLRFPGQYDDAETGLYYNCFRYYDPTTARYLSPDPLGLDAAPNPVAYVTNPHMWMDPEGLIAKGCTEDGGWYSGMKPANLKNDDGTRRTSTEMEINHIPAKNSYAHLDEPGFKTDSNGGGAGMGPSIRMEYDDHRRMTSTGSSDKSVRWREKQRALIDAGRWDQAMMMDIKECRKKFGDKYDGHIEDMIASLENNRKFQKMLEKRGWTVDYDVLK
ncbi:RHS repeat-associated core domain-containing protein [Streptomyces sp. NPDC102264]|uniref:RHS repeat-associated core domain-containing protein n=1 Tax=Streptomyces sp. NPDC102264 TaxID=3366149 RepID=UPI00380A9566